MSTIPPTSTTGEVYSKYQFFCKKINIDPLTQRRISGLLNELDTQGLINAKIVNHGRHGRTKRISCLIPNEQIKHLLSEEEIEKQLLE